MIFFQTLLTKEFTYSISDQIFVNHLHNTTTQLWDSTNLPSVFGYGSKARRTKIKKFIKRELYNIQGNFCIYCGNEFKRIRDAQREHILPKAQYPNLAFHPKNIALSCEKCNDPDHKGTNDFSLNRVTEVTYDSLDLEIIHPYLDDFFAHLNPRNGPVIEVVNNSVKGFKHRDVFKLNEGWNYKQREQIFMTRGYALDVNSEDIIQSMITINRA